MPQPQRGCASCWSAQWRGGSEVHRPFLYRLLSTHFTQAARVTHYSRAADVPMIVSSHTVRSTHSAGPAGAVTDGQPLDTLPSEPAPHNLSGAFKGLLLLVARVQRIVPPKPQHAALVGRERAD